MTTGEVGDGGDGGECVFWGGGGVTEGGCCGGVTSQRGVLRMAKKTKAAPQRRNQSADYRGRSVYAQPTHKVDLLNTCMGKL